MGHWWFYKENLERMERGETMIDDEGRQQAFGSHTMQKPPKVWEDVLIRLRDELKCDRVQRLQHNSYFLAWRGEKFGIITPFGRWKTPCEMDEYFDDEYGSNHHILPYRKGDKWGLVISDGTVIEPTYDEVLGPGDDDFVEVRLGEQWGYILCDGLRFIEKKAWEEEGDDVLVWDIMA